MPRHRRSPRSATATVLALVLWAVALASAPTAAFAAPDAPDAGVGQVAAPGLAYELAGEAPEPLALAGFVPPANTDFVLDFGPGVTTDVATVVDAAAGIWSEVLEVSEPIRVEVDWQPMGPGLLGAAGPTSAFYGHPSLPRADVLYPVALANQLAGTDLDPSASDVELVLASTIAWDRTIDGSGGGQSLLSVALHELGHGLGLTSWVQPTTGGYTATFATGAGDAAFVFDTLVGDASGTTLELMAPAALADAATSGLVWQGSAATEAAGAPVPLYAPDVFVAGSSIGHLDEAIFGAELMTPFLRRDESHLTISAVTGAMLRDVGWTVLDAPPPAPVVTDDDATAAGHDGIDAYIVAVATDFLGREPSDHELTTWRAHLAGGGDRAAVATAFAYGPEWLGVIVDDLYRSTLGRGADAGGRAFWVSVLQAGRTPAEVAAEFYASDEYHRRAGGTDAAWVADLYTQILGRSADVAGATFWVARSAEAGRAAVAGDFYQSLESRRDRVSALFGDLLGRGPDPAGWAHWAEVLVDGRDVQLAVALAVSDEYVDRASARFASR